MPQFRQDVSKERHSDAFTLSTNYSAVQTNLSIVSNPGRHKSIILTDLIVSNGDTAGYVTLAEDTNVQKTVITQRLNLAINGLLRTNFSNGLALTPNTDLGFTSSTTDDLSLTLNYLIENVITFGYTSGGHTNSLDATIDKMSFNSNANSTGVGDITQASYGVTGQSSTINGYASGGYYSAVNSNIINKFIQ